jgi:branched-chain amino acid transport system substrate-binding protein
MKNKALLWILAAIVVLVGIIAVLRYRGGSLGESTLMMASLLPLEGQVSAYGEMMRNGQAMAVEDINKENADGPKLVIEYLNTSHVKDIALDRLREANAKGIKLVVEIFGSDQVGHCLDYVRENGMVVLSGVDTQPGLVQAGKGSFFRIMPSDDAASKILVDWAMDLGTKRIAVVYANDDWGKGLLEAAEKAIAKTTLVNVATRDVVRNQGSYSSVVNQISQASPDVVFLFTYPDDGGSFLKEAKRQGLNSKFMATENFTGTDMVETAKSAAEGVMLVVPASDQTRTELVTFTNQYQQRFGSAPTVFAIKGYDAVRTLYEAATRAKGDAILTRDELRKTVRAGLGGEISFDESGEFSASTYNRLVFRKVGETYQPVTWLE